MATAELKVPILLEWKDIEAYMAQHDIVEVVRCKDCKHRPSGDEWNHDIEFPDDLCPCQCEDFWYSWIPKDDWFCGNGERKAERGTDE